mmetsp:Transcript_32380/g.49235  ORF Transcript_32380/g.49235 Transcript_32380/m.49235 type:complete len:116 (+) Transcript_32380:1169-1516(+)
MGDPFVTYGYETEYGVWPTNQCRAFVPDEDGCFADETVPTNFPTPRPSSSPIPSLMSEYILGHYDSTTAILECYDFATTFNVFSVYSIPFLVSEDGIVKNGFPTTHPTEAPSVRP